MTWWFWKLYKGLCFRVATKCNFTNMFELLERLRQKPEGVRKRFAFMVAFCVAGTILLIWASVVMLDWNESRTQQAQVEAASASPFSTFGASVATGFSAIGTQLGELKNTFTNLTSTESAHYEATSTVQ